MRLRCTTTKSPAIKWNRSQIIFEYCNATDGFSCTQAGVNDPGGIDTDDIFCFDAGDSLRVQIGGCTFAENDFDGPVYQNMWPGTLNAPGQDKKVHPSAILFTNPLSRSRGDDGHGDLQNYERARRLKRTCRATANGGH